MSEKCISLKANPNMSIGLPSIIANMGGKEGPPVVDYARSVFAGRALKRNTEDSYEAALRRIEREPLGTMPVTKVKPTDIRLFFGKVEKNRANVKAVLDMTFTAARREGLIRISPMDGANIKLPKRRQKNIKALTAGEVDRVALHATTDRDRLAIRLGGFAGLRAGEVGGLRVEDINFERCWIRVQNNAQRYTKREGERSSIGIDTPKSESSERTIEIGPELCAGPHRVHREAPATPRRDDLPTRLTATLLPTRCSRTTLVRAAKAAGLRRATFHDLRHAYATNLALNGLPMPVLQRVMGWSSIRMTDTYAHLQDDSVGEAATITAQLRKAAGGTQ